MKILPIGNSRILMMRRDTDTFQVRNVEELGQLIRSARIAQGLTQAELAETAGVGPRFISELERGKETARLGLALDIARLVGVDLLARTRRSEGA